VIKEMGKIICLKSRITVVSDFMVEITPWKKWVKSFCFKDRITVMTQESVKVSSVVVENKC